MSEQSDIAEEMAEDNNALQLFRMGAHVPRCDTSWMTGFIAEYRSRPDQRFDDTHGLASCMPPEFLALAESYIDCLAVAVFASPVTLHACDDIALECFLMHSPGMIGFGTDLTMHFIVMTLPDRMRIDPKYNDEISEIFETAALQKQIETDRPLIIENILDDGGLELRSNFWMPYPGFMRAAVSPLLQSNSKAAWPRVGARFPLQPAAISRAKSIVAFWTIQESPSVLFSRAIPKRGTS